MEQDDGRPSEAQAHAGLGTALVAHRVQISPSSMADVIHNVRWMQDHLESSGEPGRLCLLDLERALDKLKPEVAMQALRRHGVRPKLIFLVYMPYGSTQCFVRLGGHESADHSQSTGIRQGGPLSPYLFLVVMSALMWDVKTTVGARATCDRIGCIPVDEVLYVDDMILLSATMLGSSCARRARTRRSRGIHSRLRRSGPLALPPSQSWRPETGSAASRGRVAPSTEAGV